MTAVEAMACGTPTVITTGGGLYDQVRYGSEAIYADPNDPEAFGHAICAILGHPQVAELMSRHGAHKARHKFTWTAVTKQLVEVFNTVGLTKVAANSNGGPVLTEVPFPGTQERAASFADRDVFPARGAGHVSRKKNTGAVR